jgi:peroxiredoxin
MGSVNMLALVLILMMFTGCGNTLNDLNPSNSDKRPAAQPGTTGSEVGQDAPDFTISDTLGNNVTLSLVTPSVQGVVMYFTMWCPVCDGHMSNMRDVVIPAFPGVRFFAVDYVSGTVEKARSEQLASGYGGPAFTVLADTNQVVSGLYNGTMGTTIVIDRFGVIRMNEDYKDGTRLQAILSGLP